MKQLTFFVLCLLPVWMGAQNAQQFTNFMFNQLVYNPAYAGFGNSIHLTAFYRTQWVGIEGNPSLQSFSAHSPMNIGNSNIGLFVVNDILGAQRTTHFHLAYAYRQSLSFGNISFGLSAGMFQHQLQGGKLRAPQGNYETTIYHNDDLIPVATVSGIAPEFNVGIYLNAKGFQAGISANNIIAGKTTLSTPVDKSQIRFTRYYTLNTSYNVAMGKRFSLLPGAMLKTDFINYQTDFNLILQYRNNIYFGTTFRGNTRRSSDAVALLFGVNVFRNLKLGYSYDITLSSLMQVSSGSHEVFGNYVIDLKNLVKPGKKIYNPRFL
jgi:type IX secretion system PorP/SprF family membrane protein